MKAPNLRARAYALLACYTIAVFVVGSLTAVPMHKWLLAQGLELDPMHEWAADWLKLLALAAVPVLLYAAGSGWRNGLGLGCGDRGFAQLGLGFVFGVATMGIVYLLLLMLEVRVPRAGLDAAMLVRALWKAALTAVLVSIIEELWFRGALHRVLQPVGAVRTVLIVACIYAALHFLRPDVAVPTPHVVMDGVSAVGGMFTRFGDGTYADSALALLGVGLVLGWMRIHYGCIAACMGAHAGWVLVLQSVRRTTQSAPGEWSWLAGRYDGMIGWLLIIVLMFSAFVWRARQRRVAHA